MVSQVHRYPRRYSIDRVQPQNMIYNLLGRPLLIYHSAIASARGGHPDAHIDASANQGVFRRAAAHAEARDSQAFGGSSASQCKTRPQEPCRALARAPDEAEQLPVAHSGQQLHALTDLPLQARCHKRPHMLTVAALRYEASPCGIHRCICSSYRSTVADVITCALFHLW